MFPIFLRTAENTVIIIALKDFCAYGERKEVQNVTDISQIIVAPEKESLPLDMTMNRNGARVFVEIGFGNGEFLAHLAGRNPDDVFWGVEMSRSCILRALKRIQKNVPENAFLVCCDARFFLKECVPSRSLNGVFMNFPCPWPKKKHSKRRVSSGDFSSVIANVLKPGGIFELATDEEWYGMEVRNALSAVTGLKLESWAVNPERKVTTKYERKWIGMGKKIYLSRFVKTDADAETNTASPGRTEQMHVRVSGKGSLDRFLKEIYDRGEGDRETLWVCKKNYASPDGVHLLEIVATDGAFEQKFFLQFVQREEDVLVKIAPYSSPFLTPAVKGAIEGTAEKLKSFLGRPDAPERHI